MAYVKTTWTDRNVARPLTFTLQDNGDGTTTLIPSEGTIVDSGTPLNASNLNHLETQYDEVMTSIADFQKKKVTADDGYTKDIGASDPNAIIGTGWYECSSTAPNMPVTGFGWIIEHIEASTTVAYQVAYQISTNNRVFYRRKNGTTWEAWNEIAKLNHTHTIANITNLQSSLDAKANLTGATFTGTVNAPSLQEGGTSLASKYASLTGATFTGTVNAPTLQEGGTNLSSKYALLTGATFTGAVTITGNSQGLAMKAGATADHVYIGFYADSQDQATRSGFVGFGAASSTTMNLENSMANGNMRLATPSGRVYFGTASANHFLNAATDGSCGFYQSTSSFIQLYSGQHEMNFSGGYVLAFANGSISNVTSGGGNLTLASGSAVGNYAVVRGQDNVYIQASVNARVVAPLTTTTYKPILASAFTVNSYREDKNNIINAPQGALSKVLGTKVYDYHLEDELEEVIYDEKGNVINRLPKDPTTVKKRKGLISDEAPTELVFGNGIDLYAMASLLWQSVQELAKEVEGLRRTIPTTPTPPSQANFRREV